MKVREDFEDYYESFKSFFSEKEAYQKSLNYVKSLYEIKEKWSNSYAKMYFTAGVFTTSRAESMNASIKRYVNAKSEISALIRFIEDLEKEYYFEDPLGSQSETVQDKYSNEPLCLDLKQTLSPILYKKHLYQFQNAASYSNQTISEDDEEMNFLIWHDSVNNEENKEKRRLCWKKSKPPVWTCGCLLFETEGIICRHAFHIARIKNLKSLSGPTTK